MKDIEHKGSETIVEKGSLKNIFGLKDFPFLLTLLFGLLGYQINTISNSFLNSPSVEYSLSGLSDSIGSDGVVFRKYQCSITNITNDKLFKDLTINFVNKPGSSLRMGDPVIIPIPPASQHASMPMSMDGAILVYNVLVLQPGDTYNLVFNASFKPSDPDTKPIIHITNTTTIRLVEKSISTWFVKNFILVNICLTFIWLFLILLYVYKLNKQTHEKTSIV